MMELTSNNVNSIITDCLFDKDENEGMTDEEMIKSDACNHVQGIMASFSFNRERLESHREEIRSMLMQLPTEFTESGGGGWSFLNACNRKDGTQWTGMQYMMEGLFIMGIGLGLCKFLMPREMWNIFPGGMPYIVVLDKTGQVKSNEQTTEENKG